MPFLFEKLDVYRRALDLADNLSQRAAGFPRGHRALADQLTRAAISIAANIARGNGRFAPDYRGQFFAIARGSAHTCEPQADTRSARGDGGERTFPSLCLSTIGP